MAEGSPNSPRNILSWPTIWIAAAIILLVTVGSGVLLFWIYPPPGSREALDIIRTAGTLGVGTGGAAALLLHARRQRATEEANEIVRKANENTRFDAEERRISELQAKAGEQLGNDKAAVRLNALYQLEHLAQEHKDHRQTVVNVFCAYLRMSFSLPERDGFEQGTEQALSDEPKKDEAKQARQELQVRLTAQRILAEHLRPDACENSDQTASGKFWKDIDIDLDGALLVKFDLSGCRVNNCKFGSAEFEDKANFDHTVFVNDAVFGKSTFKGNASFEGVKVLGEVSFNGTCFAGHASFDSAEFALLADFESARFEKGVNFMKSYFKLFAAFNFANFVEATIFSRSHFQGAAFRFAEFGGGMRMDDVLFDGVCLFENANFDGLALFEKVKFGDSAIFNNARIGGDSNFGGVLFEDIAEFNGVVFAGRSTFKKATFKFDAEFTFSEFKGNADFQNSIFGRCVTFLQSDFSDAEWVGHGTRLRWDTGLEGRSVWPSGWTAVAPESAATGHVEGWDGVWGYVVPGFNTLRGSGQRRQGM
ncbi:pentapeptide repeat-containing protein [Saccharopolyspora sp. 5N708]|uniref:pentapeptide repeat-containing protein n=1 Tax=Saccharopolyspora sp. 5N708 TaxID=3457424 RepID=UPI003FD4D3A5